MDILVSGGSGTVASLVDAHVPLLAQAKYSGLNSIYCSHFGLLIHFFVLG